MKTRYYAIAAVLTLGCAIAFFWLLSAMPDRVPVHWNAQGVVDRAGSPWELFVAGPCLMAGIMLLFSVLPYLSPRQFAVESFERTYLSIMVIVVALLGYVFGLTMWSALRGPVQMSQAIVAGVCVMLVLLGNLLGKVRRNFYVGIRTPWTLASERVWYSTHRFGGKSVVAAAALALVIFLAGAPLWMPIALIVAGFIAPAVYSLVLYKRLERLGELDRAV